MPSPALPLWPGVEGHWQELKACVSIRSPGLCESGTRAARSDEGALAKLR